jgi:SAM-dependent methyltransferase
MTRRPTSEDASASALSPWEAMDPAEGDRFGAVIFDRAEQERWCRALFLGGLPYMWRKAEVPRRVMLDHLAVSTGERVLVLGEAIAVSGIDAEIKDIVGDGGEVVVVDFIEEARQKYAAGVIGSGGQLATWRYPYADAYPDGSFDGVLVFQGVQHAENWTQTGADLLRVLRPGRNLAMGEIAFGPPFLHRLRQDVHIEYIFDKLFSRVGWSYEDFPYYGPDDLRAAFDAIATDVGTFEWRGIELFWARRPG